MCHLMKLYTQVAIIRLDTGASGMYQIPASGGKHLGNTDPPPPASLSHFSSLCLSRFLPSIILFTDFKLEVCLIYITKLTPFFMHFTW